MAATKKTKAEISSVNSAVAIEKFFRANEIRVYSPNMAQFGSCVIEVRSPKFQGRLNVNLSLTRKEAIDFVRGVGLPVIDENAG